MPPQPLSRVAIEALLDEWLETEFTFHQVGPVARALCKLPRENQDFVLDWIRRIASTHITLAFNFAKRAPELLQRLDQRVIEAWALHLCDTYDQAGMYAALAVAENAGGFVRTRLAHADGALFDDVAPILGNFLNGLSGRRLKLEQGEGLWTDSERIVLPKLFATFADKTDNFKLAKAAVALLWAQTRYGTFRVDLQAACAGFEHPQRALARFHALETLRLSARLTRELPGLGREMQRLRERMGDSLPAEWNGLAERLSQPLAQAEDSLALLPDAYPLPEFIPWCFQGEMRPEAVAECMAARREVEKARLRVRLAELADEQARHRPTPPDGDEARDTPDFQAQPVDRDGQLDFEVTLDGAPIAPPDHVRQLITSVYLDFGHIPPEYLVPAGDGEYDPSLYDGEAEDPDAVWQGTYQIGRAHV